MTIKPMTIKRLRRELSYDEIEFFMTVYNESVTEFAVLVRELNKGGHSPRPLPETWSRGRLFAAGKPDWDLLVEAVDELQSVVDGVLLFLQPPDLSALAAQNARKARRK